MKYLLLLSIALVIFSCNKKDDPEDDPITVLLIDEFTQTVLSNNSTSTSKFNYNSNDQLISTNLSTSNGLNVTTIYTYSNGKLSSVSYSNGNPDVTYLYNGDLIISRTQETQPVRFREYSYNSNDQLTEVKFYLDGTLDCTREYIYANNDNYTTWILTCQNDVTTYQNTYDTFKNPSTLIYDENLQKSFLTTPNNLLTQVATGALPSNASYTYEYNSEGYPTKIMYYLNSVLTFVNEYTYKTVSL